MNNEALVGYTGLVGTNLARQHEFEHLYNSRNIGEIEGKSFSRLVLAAVQAKKWWANLHPQEDWALIENLLASLASVKADQVVLISTIDVLPDQPGVDEDTDPHAFDTHAYGSHRMRFEDEIRRLFDSVLIVRLPGLFGPGLKKNVIYDLLNDNQVDKINPDSRIQYYDLSALWADIDRAMEAGIDRVHLFPEGVKTAEIIQRFFPGTEVGSDAGPAVDYAYRSKHAALFGGRDGYIWSRQQVLERMGAFVDSNRQGQTA